MGFLTSNDTCDIGNRLFCVQELTDGPKRTSNLKIFKELYGIMAKDED